MARLTPIFNFGRSVGSIISSPTALATAYGVYPVVRDADAIAACAAVVGAAGLVAWCRGAANLRWNLSLLSGLAIVAPAAAAVAIALREIFARIDGPLEMGVSATIAIAALALVYRHEHVRGFPRVFAGANS